MFYNFTYVIILLMVKKQIKTSIQIIIKNNKYYTIVSMSLIISIVYTQWFETSLSMQNYQILFFLIVCIGS